MPIVFEEVSGEIMPESRSSETSQSPRNAQPPPDLGEQVRHALEREQHRVNRLSDQ